MKFEPSAGEASAQEGGLPLADEHPRRLSPRSRRRPRLRGRHRLGPRRLALRTRV